MQHPARRFIVNSINKALRAKGSLRDYFPDAWAYSEAFEKPTMTEKGTVWLTNDPPMTAEQIEQSLMSIDFEADKESVNTLEPILLVISITPDGIRKVIEAYWEKLTKHYAVQMAGQKADLELIGNPTVTFDNGAKQVKVDFSAAIHGVTAWDQTINASIITTFAIEPETVTELCGTSLQTHKLTNSTEIVAALDAGTKTLNALVGIALGSFVPIASATVSGPGGALIVAALVTSLTGGALRNFPGVNPGAMISKILPKQFLVNKQTNGCWQKILVPYLDVEVSETKGLEFFCSTFVKADRQPKASIKGPSRVDGQTSASGNYRVVTQDLQPNPQYVWHVTSPGIAAPNDAEYATITIDQQNLLVATQAVIVSAKAVDSDGQSVDAGPLEVTAYFKGLYAEDEGGLVDYLGMDNTDWSPPPAVYEVKVLSYDTKGLTSSQTPDPLVVQVDDISGHPAAGVSVWFSISGPAKDGKVSDPVPVKTDSNGIASTVVTLGSLPGKYVVVAFVEGFSYYAYITASYPSSRAPFVPM